jgi:hypothetical protein
VITQPGAESQEHSDDNKEQTANRRAAVDMEPGATSNLSVRPPSTVLTPCGEFDTSFM